MVITNEKKKQSGESTKRLNLIERPSPWNEKDIVNDIIRSYSNLIIRSYCTVRFHVIPLRFLNELSQYMPDQGTVLDLGCGFGLFALFFATGTASATVVSTPLPLICGGLFILAFLLFWPINELVTIGLLEAWIIPRDHAYLEHPPEVFTKAINYSVIIISMARSIAWDITELSKSSETTF